MKNLIVFCLSLFILIVQSKAMDSRSEMMVRYYEGKQIVKKRPPISLDNISIELDESSSITLDEEGLHASNGILILDTFSLKYNPEQPYILLTSREVVYPSEHLLLVRKDNDIYILDLEKGLRLGQFKLTESNKPLYIALIKDTYGYTSLQINDAKKMSEIEFMVYNGESYARQKVIK